MAARFNWHLSCASSEFSQFGEREHESNTIPGAGYDQVDVHACTEHGIKVSNTPFSTRNIIILNGRVCLLTTYDKSRKRRGNTNYILRVLPDALSQMVAQYIVYIRPFARVLDRRETEYLFADVHGPWAGEQLSRELTRETTKHLGVRLTVKQWRHVAIR